MNLSTTSAAFWLVTILVQAAALFYALRRKQPELATYLAFRNLKSLLLVIFLANQDAYFAIYWNFSTVQPLFDFILLRGIFRQTFQPYTSLPRRALTNIATAVSICTAALMAFALHRPALDWRLTIERCSASTIAAALVIVIGYGRLLGIPWRRRLLGVVAGYGLYLASILAAGALHGGAGGVFQYLPRTTFIVACVIWLFAIVRRPTPPLTLSDADLLSLVTLTKRMKNHFEDVTNHERKHPSAHAVRYPSRRTA
jgi:hypothetical protein